MGLYEDKAEVLKHYKGILDQYTKFLNIVEFRIRGGQDDKGKVFNGLYNVNQQMNALLKKAGSKDTSFVAIQEAEYVSAQVEDVLFDINVIKASLRDIVSINPALADPNIGKTYKAIKLLLNKLDSHYDTVKSRYDYTRSALISLTSINKSFSLRYNEDLRTFNTDNKH